MPAASRASARSTASSLRRQVLQSAGVELVLVEALRIDVAGLDPLVALFGAFAFDVGDLPLDLRSLGG